MEGKGFSFILIIILVFLSVTLAALAGYVFIVSGNPTKAPAQTSNLESTKIPADDELAIMPLIEKKNFNLKKTDDKQIAVIVVSVELKYHIKVKGIKEVAKKLEFYKSNLSEEFVTYFQNMTLEEARLTETKEKAKKELVKRLNDILLANEKEKEPIIYTIDFPEWFSQ